MNPTAALSIAGLLAGCATLEREALPDWSEGYETVDTAVPPTPDSYLRISVPDNGYEAIVHQEGDWASDCYVETEGALTDYEQITCYIEMEELDLYASNFQYRIEASGCDYVAWYNYQYEAWEVGVGPTEVSYEIDRDGQIVNEVNTVNGNPYCQYDYSTQNNNYPNCCTGSYSLTVFDQRTKDTDTFSNVAWGGEPSECYDGAAFLDIDVVLSNDGWPMGQIVLTDQAYFSQNVTFRALAKNHHTNVNLSNHYEAADHDGTLPAGLAGAWAVPTYILQCLDHAEEELARIDFIVREWNEGAQFDLAASGDPDSEGTEPVSGDEINDRRDWADATPGSTSFINNNQ